MRIALAAILYFLALFGAGFVLGPIRVLLLEPRWGAFVAVLCEAPLLLVAMFFAARSVPRLAGLKPEPAALVVLGIVALALQQAADLIVGVELRGLAIAEQFARFLTPEGLVYGVLLVVFASMPLLANLRRPDADDHSSGSVVNRSG